MKNLIFFLPFIALTGLTSCDKDDPAKVCNGWPDEVVFGWYSGTLQCGGTSPVSESFQIRHKGGCEIEVDDIRATVNGPRTFTIPSQPYNVQNVAATISGSGSVSSDGNLMLTMSFTITAPGMPVQTCTFTSN